MIKISYHSIIIEISLIHHNFMQCPQCAHPKIIKSGHVRGKQRYKCKQCGHQFVESPQPVGAPPKGTAPSCPYCEVGIVHKRSARGERLYYQCRNPECRRFSTYELAESGCLVRVMTRNAAIAGSDLIHCDCENSGWKNDSVA